MSTVKELQVAEERQLMEVASVGDLAGLNMLEELKRPDSAFFCTIPNTGDRKSVAKIYNALNSKGESLQESIGKEIAVVDVACHPVELLNKETGEITKNLRTVLIDKNGKTYSCVSAGVVSSLQKIFALVGMPSWADDPVKVVPVLEKTNSGYRVLTLTMAV